MDDVATFTEALLNNLGQEVDHFRLYRGPGVTQSDLEKAFWRDLALAAYRRWDDGLGRKPVGVPGNRDPEAPCSTYAPRSRKATDWDCASDGHYLCAECAHYKPSGEPE